MASKTGSKPTTTRRSSSKTAKGATAAANAAIGISLTGAGVFRDIPLDQIDNCPLNMRKDYDAQALAELKASVAAKGILQAIILRPIGSRYEAVIGKRRCLVLRQLAEEGRILADAPVPSNVRELSDEDVVVITAMENLHREAPSALDTAEIIAKMIDMGINTEIISSMFGYEPRRVKAAGAVGKLIEPARTMVRNGTRSIEWAQAMTLASPDCQATICDEIAQFPQRLIQPFEVRQRVESGSLLARHALFDISLYKGGAREDLFNTVNNGAAILEDANEFWRLQQDAIDTLVASLKAEGWQRVEVARDKTVKRQDYALTNNPADGFCIIEVNSKTGEVFTNRGLVDRVDLTAKSPSAAQKTAVQKTAAANAADAAAAPAGNPGFAVPDEDQIDLEEAIRDQVDARPGNDPTTMEPTGKISAYAAAHRTALVQNAVADNPKLAMAVTIVSLLTNHPDVDIRSNPYRWTVDDPLRSGDAFGLIANRAADHALERADADLTTIEHQRDRMLGHLVGLSEVKLGAVLAQVVSTRVGQSSRGFDSAPASLLNQIASLANIDVRASWTPTQEYFALYQSEDLRVLCRRLLPAEARAGIEGATRAALARLLADAFKRARAGGYDPHANEQINAWVPTMMTFPAGVEADAADLFAAEAADVASAEALFAPAAEVPAEKIAA